MHAIRFNSNESLDKLDKELLNEPNIIKDNPIEVKKSKKSKVEKDLSLIKSTPTKKKKAKVDEVDTKKKKTKVDEVDTKKRKAKLDEVDTKREKKQKNVVQDKTKEMNLEEDFIASNDDSLNGLSASIQPRSQPMNEQVHIIHYI
ncbi:hypothetical protein R6Q59_013157 [Mikania micrantha]